MKSSEIQNAGWMKIATPMVQNAKPQQASEDTELFNFIVVHSAIKQMLCTAKL